MADYSEDQAAVAERERKARESAKAFASLSPDEQQSALSQISFPGQAPPVSESSLLAQAKPVESAPAVSDADVVANYAKQVAAEEAADPKLKAINSRLQTPTQWSGGGEAQTAAGKAEETAEAREKAQRLDPTIAARAAGRLYGTGAAGTAVLRSPGGWVPSGRGVQQSIGPDAPGAGSALDDAYAEAVKGAAGSATAERAQNETLGRLQSAASNAGERFAVEGQRESQNASDKLSAVAGDIQKFVNEAAVPIRSPQEEMKNWGADKKIPFILAAALAGGTGYATGKNDNSFLENFDKFVNGEIETQKTQRKQKSEQAEQSKSVYWALHAGFKDDEAARAGTRALFYQALESRVKEAAIKYQIDSSNPRYQALLSQIDTARAHEIEALAKLTGTTTTVQSNDRFVPPSATIVSTGAAGLKPEAIAKDRAWIFNGMKDLKVPETQAELDAMRSVIMAGDKAKGGLLQKFITTYPNTVPFSAVLAQAGADPKMKQYLADLGQYVIKSGHADFGAAFTPSEQERQAVFRSPEMIPELYNRGARKLQADLQRVLSSAPSGHGYAVFDEMRSEERDMMNTPGSLVTATGSDNTLPQALPYPPER